MTEAVSKGKCTISNTRKGENQGSRLSTPDYFIKQIELKVEECKKEQRFMNMKYGIGT